MAQNMMSPPRGGIENQILVKRSSDDGDMSWMTMFQPKELWVELTGGTWYGALSSNSFYVQYVYETGMYHMFMTGANTQVTSIGTFNGSALSYSDYLWVLFDYCGTTPTTSSTRRMPVIVKLDYQGRVKPVNGSYPFPVEANTGFRVYLDGGQIIGPASAS